MEHVVYFVLDSVVERIFFIKVETFSSNDSLISTTSNVDV